MALGKYAVDYEQRVDYNRLRKERLEKTKAQMAADGVGAIITWDPDNIRYISSYYVTTPMRASEYQAVFLARNGEPHLIGGGSPSETARRMPWLGGVQPSYGMPRLSARDSNDPILEAWAGGVAKLMADYGVEKETLAIDGSTLQHLFFEVLGRKGITCVHGKPTMDYARMIKTADEIELIKIACSNSERAFAAIVDAIRPGVRECDLVGIGIRELYAEGVDHTEDLVCMSGENTNPYGWTFTDKMIRPGDLVYIDVDGASYQGYKTCIYRTFCCGKATTEQKELFVEAKEMLYAGMGALKDGATDYDVLAKWPDSPQYWGYDSWSEVNAYACGHGLGLTLHDRPMVFFSHRELGLPPHEIKAGMVMAFETWTGKKGGKHGVRIEDMVLVTETGYELLSRFPQELIECWLPY
ncbi:MAG: Xaa-Pro peptidase family protein [bacterium]